MNPNFKIFITIFCYISAVASLVTSVMSASHKPADTPTAVGAGLLAVAFLLAGLMLTRKPRY